MKKGVTKTKICISLDIDTYDKLQQICEETDAKISTKINSIVNTYIDKKEGKGISSKSRNKPRGVVR